MAGREAGEELVLQNWLDRLAGLVAGGRSLPETKRLLASYLEPLVTEDLPMEAFGVGSLAAAARCAHGTIPSYGDVVNAVAVWGRANQPAPAAGGALMGQQLPPGFEHLTAQEQAEARA